MGFHLCEWCYSPEVHVPMVQKLEGKNKFDNTSSGDVTLNFDNGHSWIMPDMILHYVADHGWQPPHTFVEDVMTQKLVGGKRRQTRSAVDPTPVGYLIGELVQGPVLEGFVEKLAMLMSVASENGGRMQTKGLDAEDSRWR